MTTTEEVELLRQQVAERHREMMGVHHQGPPTMSALVAGLTAAVQTMDRSVSTPRAEDLRVGKPECCAPGRDFDDWGLHLQRLRGKP